MLTGILLTVEGIDGAGKTTLINSLAESLPKLGKLEIVREPGGVEIAEKIRQLVKHPDAELSPKTELLLFAAARAELVARRIQPALENGTTVLMDRFIDSTVAYQGGGRGIDLDAISVINSFASNNLSPTLTIYLRLTREEARRRTRIRGAELDRLERQDDDFFVEIIKAYDAIAENNPTRVLTIDATLSRSQVLSTALHAIDQIRT